VSVILPMATEIPLYYWTFLQQQWQQHFSDLQVFCTLYFTNHGSCCWDGDDGHCSICCNSLRLF